MRRRRRRRRTELAVLPVLRRVAYIALQSL
jgi:hypothetical protein